MNDTVVLYHANCADGFGAAWAAWKALGDSPRYIPVQYGQPIPDTPVGGTVYILDFSYPRADLITLAHRSSKVVVLDHHKTAKDELEGLDGTVPGLTVRFDMHKSGAILAWEHFHRGIEAPLLLRYVQDRDLWAWELIDSREFSAALSAYPRTFDQWSAIDSFLRADKSGVSRMCADGRLLLMYQGTLVAGLVEKAKPAEVGGYTVPCVNSPLFQSEVGEELCRKFPEMPFAAVWFALDLDTEVWSLRSRNGFDVSAVAKALGGGGHPAAAGFKKARS
jgi:hypothetical protein